MQPLTDAQRSLLLGHVDVDFGCEVLNLDLTINTDFGDQGDISSYLRGGSLHRGMRSRIHGTCELALSIELPWGSVLVQPFMLLSSGGVVERFNGGVYMLTTPELPVGQSLPTYVAQGFDRLHLLDREVGADYVITANGVLTYRDALLQVFADAGLTGVQIDGAAADHVVPATRTWPLVSSSTDPDQTSTPVTWLRVVNDLQSAWNGRAVWADDDGIYRCQQYQPPSVRAPEFTFSAADPKVSILGEERTLLVDLYRTPNRWKFLWKNRPGGMQDVPGDGSYQVDNVDEDDLSQDARGLVWSRTFEYEAASQAVLEALGDRRVAGDRRVVTTIKATTGPFPVAGHFDVFELVDSDTAVTKVQALEWEMPLDGGDVEWTWEAVI